MPRLEHTPPASPSPFGEITPREPSKVSGVQQLLDRVPQDEPTLENSKPLSPTADKIEATADRIATFLRSRAEERQKTNDQEDALESYSENIKITKSRERHERYEEAKAAINTTARAALVRLKSAGMITLGLGIAGAEATAQSAKAAKKSVETSTKLTYETAKSEVSSKIQDTGEAIVSGWNKAESIAGSVGQSLEGGIDTAIEKTKSGIDTVKYTVYATKESIKYAKDQLLARREAALTRKYERHARWSRIKHEAKAMAETYREKRARSIGRTALANNLFES